MTRVVVLEPASAHELTDLRSWEDFRQLLPAHVFKFLRFQLLFVQRADEFEISELLNHCDGGV